MKTQLDYVYEHEKNTGDRVWLTQPMGKGEVIEITWKRALDEARRMAAHLDSLGYPKGSNIALFSKNSAWWFLADLAIWMAGHVSVPLYPTLTPGSIAQILDHSEAKLIFVGKLDGFAAMEPGIPKELPRIALPLSPKLDAPSWNEIIAKTEPIAGSPTRDPDDLATIVYTSGSTGVPKGVMHSFRTMCGVRHIIDLIGGRPDDRMLSYLPLAHVAERCVIETPSMMTGGQIFFAESLDTFVQDLRRAKPTLFLSVPRLWHKFQAGVFSKMPPKKLDLLLKIPIVNSRVKKKILEGLGLDHVRYAASGSAPIPAELIAWYRRLGLELLEGYGMSENFAISHATRPGEVKPGFVGRAYDSVECKLSEEGEILVKSPSTMLGYYKAPELTAEVIDKDGFLHTGDRGVIDKDGSLKITGRVKELFKTSKGKYVAPAPIENELLLHPEIEQACVSGANMPQPYALVVLTEQARADAKDGSKRAALERSLSEHLTKVNASLDQHENLEKLVVVSDPWTIENAMLTPTMKLKRSAIESAYEPKVEGWYSEKAAVLWV